jgi:hypothetical protein
MLAFALLLLNPEASLCLHGSNNGHSPRFQQWAFEVHSEVPLWALNQWRPIMHNEASG